ncbi:MAG: thioredoxin [Paludibacteraceae bacterium]|nr:thioredoxin [Paludibacteraceae bacterium]MBN2786819.1 thioredoxin [Paludibacteraceae bacterium]
METKNFKEIIQSDQPVVIDFYAPWCGPCKAMTPILENLKSKLGEQVKIIKIDVDENPDIAVELEIRSIPTLMIYQNGEKKWKKVGLSSVDEMLSVINTLNKN